MIGSQSAQRLLLLASVARHGTMTQAAQAVGYSVSAISQQIRKLEQETGLPLVQRHSRGIILTDAGEAVVRHAEKIQGQMNALQSSLDDIAGLRAGTLRMGTFPTVGSSLLPLAISRFRAEHPGVDLSVRSFRRAALLSMLYDRQISMSLLWDYQWSRLELPELDLKLLIEDPTDVVVSATHPLADRETVSVAELLDESWVVRADNHPMHEIIVSAANQVGFEPKVAYEANDYQEVQAMVAVGVGISLIPRLALTVLRNDVRIIPLSGEVPRRRVLLGRMNDIRPTGAELAMTSMLVAAAADMSEPDPVTKRPMSTLRR